MTNQLKLWCLLYPENNPNHIFQIKIDSDEAVASLKGMIKFKNASKLNHIAAPDLEIWKCSIPLGDGLQATLDSIRFDDTHVRLDPLITTSTVRESFLEQPPPPKTLHIIVKPPPVKHRAEDPLAWIKLMKYNLILVRGTPGTGKTVLASLLENHAKTALPAAQVIAVGAWLPDQNQLWDQYLTEKCGWRRHRNPTVFIFDEAQLTYSNYGLWITFLKNLREDQYAILFASYGSVKSMVHHDICGIPIVIPARQKITLQHLNHNDGLPAVGLFFTEEEFMDLVKQKYSMHCFDKTFFAKLLEFMGGHIGAIGDCIKVIEGHGSYRTAKHYAQSFSWETFCKEVSPEGFVKQVNASSSMCSRGLSQDGDLQNPNVFEILSTVLRDGVVYANEVPNKVQGLMSCVQRGWLHNDNIGESGGPDEIVFFLPTSLHRWYTEWKLFGHQKPMAPPEVGIIEFVVSVVRLFDPRILSAERRIGPGGIQRMPEAQYQDEFYRCGHAYSGGSLLSFPEFGTVAGRADFYVQSKKWGVELLCNGNQLAEHSGQFSHSGAYGGTLAIDDYVILDCHTAQPQKPHQDLNKLYHVVFKNNFEEVDILDNMLQPLNKFRLLLAETFHVSNSNCTNSVY